MLHPFVIGEKYADRRGEYTVTGIEGNKITIKYDDGIHVTGDLSIKERIYRNILVEQKLLHPIQTERYFNFLGFLAGHSEFNAEVPPQSQSGFEQRYFLVTGVRPIPRSQGYFPINIETTWDKWASELRIIFPLTTAAFDLPPGVEMRAGIQPGTSRINNNQFWWLLVRVGFRLGKSHNIEAIRASIPGPFRAAFDAGLSVTARA